MSSILHPTAAADFDFINAQQDNPTLAIGPNKTQFEVWQSAAQSPRADAAVGERDGRPATKPKLAGAAVPPRAATSPSTIPRLLLASSATHRRESSQGVRGTAMAAGSSVLLPLLSSSTNVDGGEQHRSSSSNFLARARSHRRRMSTCAPARCSAPVGHGRSWEEKGARR
jgi:hypothetical protein